MNYYETYDDYLRDIGELPDKKEELEATKEMWQEIKDDDRR